MSALPAQILEWVVLVFVAGVGANILYKMWSGRIDFSGLLSELPDTPPAAGASPSVGKASMSRLQLLLFTFVIIGLYMTLSFENGKLIEIPDQVLGLLGISGASYVVSKGIQLNK
jgi:hypothetical protein